MKKPPANWTALINTDLFNGLVNSKGMRDLLEKAQEKYVNWEVFRHYSFPAGFTAEQGWALLKMSQRLGTEITPILDKEDKSFSYNLTKGLYKRLSFIDTHAAGLVQSLSGITSTQRDQLLMSSITEEAIASSQIEGANTSRKVAKEMLYSGRKARTTSEQMIINNYQVMQLLADLKDENLSEEVLLDIQRKITHQTLENPEDAGRFRRDEDNIAVMDKITGEIAFDPPQEEEMRKELKKLIAYANGTESGDRDYVHAFIKATILHFWLAYLHPFVDGNGRTARALFYWYLLKQKYWLFEYLAISRIIKTSKKKYDKAFLDTENDENDLTYFIYYITEITCRAIEEMRIYFQKKIQEAEDFKSTAKKIAELNERQVAVLTYFKTNPDKVTNIKHHQVVHGIVYETARQDLMGLTKKGLLVETVKGKKKIYIPNRQTIKKFLKGA